MAGLSLGASAGFAVPAASLPPSYARETSGSTISARAYGIAEASAGSGRPVAGTGSVGVGLAATALLAWLWYSLPR